MAWKASQNWPVPETLIVLQFIRAMEQAHVVDACGEIRPRLPGEEPDYALGRYDLGCDLLLFAGDYLERMPDAYLQALIAHELAHWYHDTLGWLDEMDFWETEEQADLLAAGWGFDVDGYNEWKDAHDQTLPPE